MTPAGHLAVLGHSASRAELLSVARHLCAAAAAAFAGGTRDLGDRLIEQARAVLELQFESDASVSGCDQM